MMFIIYFAAPTSAPLNVNITCTNSTTLNVRWSPPAKVETHGIIRTYNIRYRQVQCTINGTNITNWTTVTVNGSFTSVKLKNLAKWSCYEVQICATTIKSGIWSEINKQRTREDGMRVFVLFRTMFTAGVFHYFISINLVSVFVDGY